MTFREKEETPTAPYRTTVPIPYSSRNANRRGGMGGEGAIRRAAELHPRSANVVARISSLFACPARRRGGFAAGGGGGGGLRREEHDGGYAVGGWGRRVDC